MKFNPEDIVTVEFEKLGALTNGFLEVGQLLKPIPGNGSFTEQIIMDR